MSHLLGSVGIGITMIAYGAFSFLIGGIKQENKEILKKEENKEIQKIEDGNLFRYGWKDHLFGHHNGTWLDEQYGFDWVSYDQVRDLENVDEIDVDKAFPKYVSLDLKDKEKYKEYLFEGKKLQYYEISGGDKFLLIFVHGLNGNATWGFKDWTFGGNFNRLKHIVYHNGGTYISPTIKGFSYGAKQLGSLIKEYKQKNNNMKIYISCGSSGGETCWKLYDDETTQLDGIILVGSMPPLLGIQSVLKRNIPIYYGHGEKDKSMPVGGAISTYRNLIKQGKNIKLEVFTNGVHGTPIRMIDWLKTLRWIVGEENIIGEDKGKNIKDAESFSGVKEIFPK